VEAMACGVPVIASRAGSLPEVVGPAGVYFDPTDVGSMAITIRDFLNSPEKRSGLAATALERAAMFSWDASAHALLRCFDELGPSTSSRKSIPPRVSLGRTRRSRASAKVRN